MRAEDANPAGMPATVGARRAYLLETGVFFLVLLPWMGFATVGTRPEQLSFPLVAAIIILHDLALTALALYLVWRNGEGLAAVGWVRQGIGREALIGLALFVPLLVGLALLQALLRGAGLAEPMKPPSYLFPQTRFDYAVAIALLVTVAIAEETVFRGYMIRRFGQLTGSIWFAVLLSSAIFALGHGYQGSLGIIAVGVIGLVFAVIYLKRGSLVAPMVMHFLQNFLGLVVAPKVAELGLT